MGVFNLETLWLGLNNLRLHKLRSLLTALGIIFGVAAVICMLSISEGATADEMRLIKLLGTQNIIITSVRPQATGRASEANTHLLTYGITERDYGLIRETIPHIERLVPLKTIAFEIRRQAKRTNVNVIGTTAEFFRTVHAGLARGRPLAPADESDLKNVCVIGDDIRREVFAHEDPLGQSIFVVRQEGTIPYTVVGVLELVETAGAPRRGIEERNINREIYIPFSTAERRYGDIIFRQVSGTHELLKSDLSALYLTADSIDSVLPVSEMVRRVFETGHDRDDFDIRVPLQTLQLAERKKRNSQLLLGFIAGISLVVGGIGIMNIMLASVTERTREIGIRRALGARRKHIVAQFLTETVILTTAGGLCGIALGWGGSTVITQIAAWGQAIVQPWAILTSFGLSVVVGIVSGLWPAVAAARLDPIEALRYE